MSFELEINEEELHEFLDRGQAAMERAMYLTLIDYESRIVEEVPTDQGQLSGSWRTEQDDAFTGRVISDLEHAASIAYGTDAIPNLPWDPIAEWAHRKGLPPFPVWMKIREEGVTANPYHERAWQRTRGRLQEFMAMAVGETAT